MLILDDGAHDNFQQNFGGDAQKRRHVLDVLQQLLSTPLARLLSLMSVAAGAVWPCNQFSAVPGRQSTVVASKLSRRLT